MASVQSLVLIAAHSWFFSPHINTAFASYRVLVYGLAGDIGAVTGSVCFELATGPRRQQSFAIAVDRRARLRFRTPDWSVRTLWSVRYLRCYDYGGEEVSTCPQVPRRNAFATLGPGQHLVSGSSRCFRIARLRSRSPLKDFDLIHLQCSEGS
jgi:hypothetical protein